MSHYSVIGEKGEVRYRVKADRFKIQAERIVFYEDHGTYGVEVVASLARDGVLDVLRDDVCLEPALSELE